eukprot:jgi/Ulvmu1/6203/UM028_0059.1
MLKCHINGNVRSAIKLYRPRDGRSAVHARSGHETSVAHTERRTFVWVGILLTCGSWVSVPSQAATIAADLPTDFVSLERKLIQSLRESIQLQQEGATESEVRKSAENAKGPIKEFLGKWKTDQRVEGNLAWLETAKAIEELGQYYIRRGQRAALDKSTAASILKHLDAAENVLPEEEEQKKFFGLF